MDESNDTKNATQSASYPADCSASVDLERLLNLYLVEGKDNYNEEWMYVLAFDFSSAATIAEKRWKSIGRKHEAVKVDLIATQNHYENTGFLSLAR